MPRASDSMAKQLDGVAAAPEAGGVGPRIKALRTARRVSLRQLADMTGTTASSSASSSAICAAPTPARCSRSPAL
ncbi:helix-turn-helix domain-containing protein [Mesorhizobium sp. M8A.F.Ca.ET.165.01.1.1]|uniref:helix-turn-helix domain-containing protein n=1 Tax=Mesorhizobium sp. M8A.F.Ca.ET.165.01.1.1 TaxID=2563960 RepID=UPI001FDEE739|nr:helix-turn-helix domain-containing protein [Mesorhizobium sp. M8A.F.Ca.ET.165.01.1.1]